MRSRGQAFDQEEQADDDHGRSGGARDSVRRRWPGPQDGSGAQAKGRVEDAAAEDEDEAEYGDLGWDWPGAALVGELWEQGQEDEQPPWGSSR
jgi:hypothetical protein